MPILCDAHVHFYSCYPLREALACAERNLESLSLSAGLNSSEPTKLLCLTERYDCNYFRLLSERADADNLSAKNSTEHNLGNYIIKKTSEPHSLSVHRLDTKDPSTPLFYLISGRQIVTRERVELLSLCCNEVIPDGLPLNETLEKILHCKAVPVINWAPGKWLFKRGKLIAEVLRKATPNTLVLGDTSLRPRGFPEPRMMRKARSSGFTVIAGSDPLPFSDEHFRIGTYGMYSLEDLDLERPANALRNLLLNKDISKKNQQTTPPKPSWQYAGKRNSLFALLRRLQRLRAEGKRHREPK